MLKILSNKKGLSAVVTTILLIALTMAIVAFIWVVVNNLVKEQTSGAASCFGILDKVKLNPRYTCYNGTESANEFWFSIDVGELDVEDILVSISGEGSSESFRISENPAGLSYYPSRTQPVAIPGKNQGLTYIYQLPSSFTKSPDSVEIAPVIDGELCGASSSIEQFD